MTTTCRCRKPGEQSDCVNVALQWSPLALALGAQRDVDFFSYMQQHAVAVFETQGVEGEERALLAKPERKAEGE
ncbi:hypothetical protein KIN20_015686 [Parelaphostrongylus tenuis]|uniref:Uncharacterized protein n=1 Tax=Parelaphostrongylus tenuis TaxID=148309 RepID=A0AAD5MYU1_PARTN|nr:hypothetical protein KIN20_015686 [Parelaphostrongylus tenuis]